MLTGAQALARKTAQDIMTREVLAVDKDDRLEVALDLMRKFAVSKLVVIDDGDVVGVLVDGDIADELGALKNRGVPLSQLHVSSAMRREFPHVTPATPLPEVLSTMVDGDEHLIPVLHDRRPVGVITASDALRLVESDMRLEEIMTDDLHVVNPTDRVIHARRVMLDEGLSHLPVLEQGKLVGILGELDVAFGFARFRGVVADRHQSAGLQRFLVGDIMNRNLVTTVPEANVEEALRLMRDEDVGSLPVLRGDRLVGIVTRSDLLALLPR